MPITDYFGEARVIILRDIRNKLSDMKELVEQKVYHPYLLKFIQTPYIDEDKLLILISILDRLDLPNNKIQNYALTTMLIQIALDTHENISNAIRFEEESDNQTSKQLTVLAGDYYSGLYYMLLAETDDIPMIRTLSSGIKEVNEHKILVFQKEFDGIEKLMSSIKIIESSLFSKLIEFFQLNAWKEVVTNLLFIKRLLDEKRQYSQSGHSVLFEALKKIIFPKFDFKSKDLSNEQERYLLIICDRYIDFSKQLIENGLKHIPVINEFLESRIRSILNQHQPVAKTFVEEG